MKDKLMGGGVVLLIVVIVLSLMYGMACIAKTLSYKVWYEDKVKETVIEMIETDPRFIKLK